MHIIFFIAYVAVALMFPKFWKYILFAPWVGFICGSFLWAFTCIMIPPLSSIMSYVIFVVAGIAITEYMVIDA